MPKATIRIPVTTSMATTLDIPWGVDPGEFMVEYLLNVMTRDDLASFDVEPVEWDHIKAAWKGLDPDECWIEVEG